MRVDVHIKWNINFSVKWNKYLQSDDKMNFIYIFK